MVKVAKTFSTKTLFNGDNIGLQTYSVVHCIRLYHQSIRFLKRRAFENWTSKTEHTWDLRGQIVKFFWMVSRELRPPFDQERFKIMRFERDELQKTESI